MYAPGSSDSAWPGSTVPSSGPPISVTSIRSAFHPTPSGNAKPPALPSREGGRHAFPVWDVTPEDGGASSRQEGTPVRRPRGWRRAAPLTPRPAREDRDQMEDLDIPGRSEE